MQPQLLEIKLKRDTDLTQTVDGSFSHNSSNSEKERIGLENRYKKLIIETDLFSRRTVSFQANKVEALHSWMKYREGFSSELVSNLFKFLDISAGHHVLDPFAGSCTTLLQAMFEDINSTGVELLPNCQLAWGAKSNVFLYDIEEIVSLLKEVQEMPTPSRLKQSFKHLKITESAFPKKTEDAIIGYTEWINQSPYSDLTKNLFKLILMSLLEDLSYTRKDGQYLRWDGRSEKIVQRNKERVTKGKPIINGIDKGDIPTTKDLLVGKFSKVAADITSIQKNERSTASKTLIQGNTLFELPKLGDEEFDCLITSPPYLNRYDYTRTYALELAFLDVDKEIFSLRQDLLSATVESKSKTEKLKDFYKSIGREEFYHRVLDLTQNDPVLNEILSALNSRINSGEVNNKAIVRMVKQYFEELTFVFAEAHRLMKSGGKVVFVNDNVRYAGEVIPVDTLSTHLAESVGFIPMQILVIPQRKGNSSQQMKKYGRRALRKSLTIWKKQ